MKEFRCFGGSTSQIELDFVEWEATLNFLIKLSIQLYLSELPRLNTVSVLGIFGVKRARSTVHNWIHKAGLQPTSGKDPDHVAVDETVIQLNDDQYWLYTAVDPETSKLLYTSLEPTTNTGLAEVFLAELSEKHDLLTPSFSLMAPTHCGLHVIMPATISKTRNMEIGTLSNVTLENSNAEQSVSRTVSATPQQTQPTNGSDSSAWHGISLFEHYRRGSLGSVPDIPTLILNGLISVYSVLRSIPYR